MTTKLVSNGQDADAILIVSRVAYDGSAAIIHRWPTGHPRCRHLCCNLGIALPEHVSFFIVSESMYATA